MKMGGNKTIDGIKICTIVKLLEQLPEVEVRDGKKHPHLAVADGFRACPIAVSTHAKRIVVPWIAQVTGYEKGTIYNSLKSGEWYN